MKKLHLDVDSLRVESFAAGAGAAGGTVNAFSFEIAPGSDPIVTDSNTDTSRVESCYFNTCYDTCDWTQ